MGKHPPPRLAVHICQRLYATLPSSGIGSPIMQQAIKSSDATKSGQVDEYKRLSKLLPKLGISRRVLYYWAGRGMIPGAVQLNGVWLYREADVDAWLQSKHAEMDGRCVDFLRMREPPPIAQRPAINTQPYEPTSPAAKRFVERMEGSRAKKAAGS